jgi:Cytochrome c554 and c-prime
MRYGARIWIVCGLSFLPLPGSAAADYIGAEACRSCHPAEFAGQSASGHARALSRSADSQPGEWAFGAGVQAITFVSRVDRESYRELGQTWYRALNGYAVTPGHLDNHRLNEGIEFRTFDPAARMLRCFACHTTGPLALGEGDQVLPHEMGVRCEVCHGPGAAHAADPSRNRPRNPAHMAPIEMNSFCGKCHRLDLDTGEELTNLRDPRILRSPARMLASSACFQKSNSRLNCVTCHSPHAPLEQKLAAYDATCRHCHAAPRHAQPVTGRACAECHLPAVRMGEMLFTNHRIAVYTAKDPVVPVNAVPVNARGRH